MKRILGAFTVLLSIVSAIAAPGCGAGEGPAQTLGVDRAALGGAEPTQVHPFAVSICTGPSESQCTFRCSGTLIAPNLVLTVRHCIYPVPNPLVDCTSDAFGAASIAKPGEFWVSTAPRLAGSEGRHRVLAFRAPSPPLVCGADVAALILQDPVAISDATPAKPALDALTDRSKYSTTVAVIANGESGPGALDFGVRRVRQANPIKCLPDDPAIPPCSDLGKNFVDREFVVSTGACQGDSGSGAFEQLAFNKGDPILVGVLSRGTVQASGCSDGVYERLDKWAGFIAGAGKLAAGIGGYPVPEWANVPDAQNLGSAPNPYPPRSLGAACASDADCNSSLCLSSDRGFTFACTQHCDAATANACPSGFSCLGEGADAICRPRPGGAPTPSPATSCAMGVSGRTDAGWCASALAVLALVVGRRRRML